TPTSVEAMCRSLLLSVFLFLRPIRVPPPSFPAPFRAPRAERKSAASSAARGISDSCLCRRHLPRWPPPVAITLSPKQQAFGPPRLDQRWSNRNNSFVRVGVSPSLATGLPSTSQNQVFGQNAGSRTGLNQSRDLSVTFQHDTTVSATAFNEFRFQYA